MKPWWLYLILAAVSPGFAPEKDEFHVFTDKNGKTISAKILAIDDSRRMAEIKREDGRTCPCEFLWELGQKWRVLQVKARRHSWPQSGHCSRVNPTAGMPSQRGWG